MSSATQQLVLLGIIVSTLSGQLDARFTRLKGGLCDNNTFHTISLFEEGIFLFDCFGHLGWSLDVCSQQNTSSGKKQRKTCACVGHRQGGNRMLAFETVPLLQRPLFHSVASKAISLSSSLEHEVTPGH